MSSIIAKPNEVSPHINAKAGDFAKTVLMSGDPLRAKWIAETFLKDARLVTDVRNMLGYTGTYKGVKVSVMGHGMGIPSIGIYSYELYKFFDVDNIVRLGTCGSYVARHKVGDVVMSKDSFSRSPYAEIIGVEVKDQILPASARLRKVYAQVAKDHKIGLKECRVHASDSFYTKWKPAELQSVTKNSEVTEMEAFGLFAAAKKHGKDGLVLLTVVDSFVTPDYMDAKARQSALTEMATLGLEGAVALDQASKANAKKKTPAKKTK